MDSMHQAPRDSSRAPALSQRRYAADGDSDDSGGDVKMLMQAGGNLAMVERSEGRVAEAGSKQARPNRSEQRTTEAVTEQTEQGTTEAVTEQAEQRTTEVATERPPEEGTTREGSGGAGPACIVSAELVQSFNACFGPVLHALGATGEGGGVNADDLRRLFTAGQIEMLRGFVNTSVVPQRLFNGVTNKVTPQQRILLSSHILLTGTFDPATVLGEAGGPQEEATEEAQPQAEGGGAAPNGDGAPDAGGDGAQQVEASEEEASAEEQGEDALAEEPSQEAPPGGEEQPSRGREISANSCRHWAMLVYGYAGLPVPGDGVDGIQHTHDATGAINIGGSAPAQTRGGYGSARSFVQGHADQTWAPYFSQGTQAASIFQPGDWLQLAWSRRGGGYNTSTGHSVVLSQVKRETATHYFVDYYSQTNNTEGRRALDENQRLSKRVGAGSVVFAHRPMSQARDPESAADLFEGLHSERDGRLTSGSPNERTIRQRARGVREIEPGGEVLQWLCGQLVALNRARLDALGDRLTTEQRGLLDAANVVGAADLASVEQLVRVNQRVVHTLENDAHSRHSARRQQDQEGHYWVGRAAGGNGLIGAWDPRRRGDDDAPLPMRGDVGGAQLRQISRGRCSGLLQDMPDASLIRWSDCPQPQATAGG